MDNVSIPAIPMVSMLADDADMQPLVHMFVDDVPAKVQVLSSAMAQEDWESAKQLAHQLKGSAAGYGFPALTDAAGLLERFLSQPQPNEQHVRQSALAVLDMLQRLRAE